MCHDLSEFSRKLCANISRWADLKTDEQAFDALALELFALQIKYNPAYARLCANRGQQIKDWRQIPAMPAVAFKEMEMTSLPAEQRTTVFSSSGTTKRQRGRHFHSNESLGLYEESLYRWFRKLFRREMMNVRWLFLTPTGQDAPTSSLAHMFSTIAARASEAESVFSGVVEFNDAWTLDYDKATEYLLESERKRRSVAILGTAFLFVNLLDALERTNLHIRLPENSWVMETGGYKGRSREMPKQELHRSITDRLGVAPNRIFGEYGMSELSSQAYAGADGLFRFPPWARAQIISPATGCEARAGERGLIRVYDLANVWSVMAVQTEDIGISEGNGFRLVGRAAEAEARGCSLMTA